MTDADVVIVGTGVMGAAAARSLARRGREVVMLDRFRIGHDRGSSHGRARIFRLSYEDPTYVEMAREALPLWRELEAEAGEQLLTTTGGLDLGAEAQLDRHSRAMASVGVQVEMLKGSDASERFPAVSLLPDEPAVFQADSGVIQAQRAWRAFASSARAHGAVLREEAPVVSVGESAGRAEVRLEGETITARVAVITAGAWARDLLGGAGIELPTRPTRETVAYFDLDADAPVMIEWSEPAVYALPAAGLGIKAAEHHAGPRTDPDHLGSPDNASVDRVSAWMAKRFPEASPRPQLTETCIYTNTDDESFVLERRGPFVIGSACSGHAFKFAPLIGARLAELASA
jgi:sarcosine oxidase